MTELQTESQETKEQTRDPRVRKPSLAENEPRRLGRGVYVLLTIVATLLAVGAVASFMTRFGERRALAKETETLAVPAVLVVHPKPEPPQQEIILPSTLQAYIESPIYARTNGYLGKWYKDIGSRVAKGELLAEIETPEIDQELMQARAARDQASAQLEIAKTSAQRWENLRKMDAVAQQETDERASTYAQQQAALASSAANVRRLEQLESFKHIYSPFSGVLTKRNVDIGALVNSGNGGSNQELFDIAQIDPIRVYIDVPEIYAAEVHRGLKAQIELSSLPRQKFSGSVARSADAIDPPTRTLRTEIDVPNREGRLFPGAFAQVHFAVNVAVPLMAVPVNALLFRAEGPRAAVVDADGIVHLKAVTIGRDYGTEVEILSGLDASDALVLNPSDSLEEGQKVQVTKGGGQS